MIPAPVIKEAIPERKIEIENIFKLIKKEAMVIAMPIKSPIMNVLSDCRFKASFFMPFI